MERKGRGPQGIGDSTQAPACGELGQEAEGLSAGREGGRGWWEARGV